ncbi:unnamed protein product, partial [Cochlearia groenlandica]
MMSVRRRRSEVIVDDEDDVFFDSYDEFSQVWSCELLSVEERRERFLKKIGLFEEKLESMRLKDDTEEEASCSYESSLSDSEAHCCVREEKYGETSSMYNEEEEVEREESLTDVSSSPSGKKKSATKKWVFLDCFLGEKRRDFVGYNKATMSKVKVKTNKKSHVELSQEIVGHKGKIWSLKFSPNGKFLATGGEDGVLKIWRITMKNTQEDEEEEAMVLFPQKAFRIDEKPFQELYGHKGDILDLSWSDSNLILSASKDKTVRLWRIGCDQCLHVFHHNNYVTCVEFSPVNNNNFVSGCIDGKARIWGLSEERVVAWTDVRDAISAICYQPNGNGFVVGCITGSCRFYQISGNDVVMEEQILLRGRHRITCVEFCPRSSEKIMVSSDDSKLRIFDKSQIFHKFKASLKCGKQSSASFVSSAGKHILSVRRGLGVYIWNNDSFPANKRSKSSRSFVYFQSPGISAA